MIAGAALANSFIIRNLVPIYLSMYGCLQDLLVLLSCRPHYTKIAYTTQAGHTVPNRKAHGQRDVSRVSGCHVMYLPPHFAGVTQNVFPV